MNGLDSQDPAAPIADIAFEVARILEQRLETKDLVQLLKIVFLDVDEAASLLRVKKRTVYEWISQEHIPVRYANGKPIFLLAELLNWTLPENDKHSECRLPLAMQCNIATQRLAAIRERASEPCQ